MGVKFWLEGFGPKPHWLTDENTSASIQVDKQTIRSLKGLVRSFVTRFNCFSTGVTAVLDTSEDVPDDMARVSELISKRYQSSSEPKTSE